MRRLCPGEPSAVKVQVYNYRHNAFNVTLDATDGPKIGALTNDNSQTPARIYLGVSTDKKVANVIDKDRLGIVAQRFNLNDDDGSGMFDYDVDIPQAELKFGK